MKTLVSVLLAVVVGCVPLAAQSLAQKQEVQPLNPDTAEMQTTGAVGGTKYNWTNGRAWMTLTDDAKIALVVGLEQGIVLSVRENWAHVPPADQQELSATATRLTLGGFTFTQVAVQIDALYLQQANQGIPIVDAYEYALLELKNTPPKELGRFLDQIRETYHLPAPPTPEKKK